MILLKNCLIALCTLLVVTTAAHAQLQSPTNVVVDGNSGNKSETSIVVDPNNPEHLMATWNDFTNGTTSKPGWAFSTDGGTSWYTKGTITPSTTYSYGFDPSCAIGRDGNEYYAYVATPSSGSHGPVDVSVSTNDGQSWNTQQVSVYSSDHDKPYIAVDTTTGKDSGNVYVAYQSSYIQQNDPNNPDIYIMLSTSPAGGSNWTRAVVDDVDVNSSQDNTINMADPSVGPHGTVYVAYYVGTGTSDGPAEIRVAKSTSGGANFKVIYTFSISGAYQDYYGWLRVSSIPTIVVDPTNGNIYLAFVEHDSNGDHIYFTRSTDGGTTWSTPTIVTQVTSGDQFFPWLTVNSTGSISLVYYDYNNGGVAVYSAQSFNSGQSFAGQAGTGEDVELTSAAGSPTVDGGMTHGYLDYLGVASDSTGEVHAVWTDFSSEIQQNIYCANYNQKPSITVNPNYIDAGGSGAYCLLNGSQNNSITVDLGTPITLQTVPQNSNWQFAGWNFGSDSNPVTYYPTNSGPLLGNLKELQHSMDTSAYSDNSQRKFIRVNATGYLFQTYDDGGHSWLEYSTNGGSSWNLANYGEPLDYNFTNGTSPGSKDPSLAYYDRDGYDIVAAVFEEPNSTGHYSIYLDVFYNSNGSYQPFGPQWIDDEPDSTYSADANPNVVLNGPENNSQLEFIVTFEKSTVNGQAGIGCKAGVLLANYSYEVSQLTPAQLVDGTDSYSQDATVYANYSATNPGIYCDIAWEEYYSSSSIQIEGSGIDFSESGGSWVYNGEAPTLISNNSCPVNYAPSIIQMPDGSVQICWIMDLSGGQHQPLSTQVVYWSSDYPTTFNEFGSDPYYVSLNLSNDATDPQRFVWSDYGGSGNDDWWGYISDGQSVVNQNNNGGFGPHVQINNAQSSGDMITSIYRHFNTPYYFKTYMNQLGKTSRSALFTTYSSQTGALTTWRGVAISEGKLHYYYSFGRLNVDGQNIGIASAPDSVAYTTSGRIVKVFESKPCQVTDSSRILFDENSGFVDSSAAASVLGKNGFIDCKVDLIDNATGELVSTVKEIKEGSSDPHGYSFVPYLLTTDGIGQKTVRAQIVITTNLDSVKTCLLKGTAIDNPTSGSLVQSLSLDHLSLQIIKSYTLLQNYPNPFNPTTNIGYTLPKAEHVTLTVYDVLGQKVETLVNEEQNVGRYQVQFNGSRLASGVYFYRLVAGKHVITKKMLMLK